MMDKPRYKTWIRSRAITVFGGLTLACLILSLFAFTSPVCLVFLLPAFLFGYIFFIIGLSGLRLSPAGGNYQEKIHSLLVTRTAGKRMLDIGCGSGHLLSRIAGARPDAELTGIDYWGDNWEYSKELCLENFRAENITNKVEFRKETASRLPENMGGFDCIVSCLTFHEVRDVADKTISLKEALRHLNKGGKFIFLDLFKDSKFYPDYQRIADVIEDSQCRITERAALNDLLPLPFPLKHGKVLGKAELIAGEKI